MFDEKSNRPGGKHENELWENMVNELWNINESWEWSLLEIILTIISCLFTQAKKNENEYWENMINELWNMRMKFTLIYNINY